MRNWKNFVALATLVAVLASFNGLSAQDRYNTGGMLYEEVRRSPAIAPAVALGTIALVAIIAVAVQNRSHGGHGHSH